MLLRALFALLLLTTPALAQLTLYPALEPGPQTRTVTIYSSLDEPLARPMIAAFQAHHPTVAVASSDMQTADIYERIVRETDAGEPTADFAFSSAMDLQMKLANDGYAQPAPVPLAQSWPRWATWRDTAYALTYEPAVFIYNKAAFADDGPPTTRGELLDYLEANADADYGRIGTCDIERSGGGRFLVAPAPASDAGWAAIVREATLTGRSVVVELDDGLPEEGRRWVERATHLGWALTCVDELPVRDLPDRARSEHVASADLVTDDEWRAAVGPGVPLEHRLTAEQTELVAAVHPTVDGDVHVAVRRLLAGPLGTLARRVRPQKSWDDLVLSGTKLAQLRSIVARYQHAGRVLDDWGLSHAAGRGIVSLFTGQSGTGKTLAAEVVASELGLDMYRIDISTVVSKYIGETEQNLERLFAAASAGSSVLFFDEADSLFGKRAEVKDGRDRYANLEVSYLLQRLETYDGIVVLATNLPKNIDDAFLRRIHFVVDFPTPAGPERRAIWERHLRDGVPQGDLDLDLLARRYELTGGVIRNAVVAAAFQAADEDRPVEMRHLGAALMAEYVKLGRVVREEDFDGVS